MNRESLIFCSTALIVTVAVCTAGFSLAALPRQVIDSAKKPVPAENLPDIDLGDGFGKVSIVELMGYYMENPPAAANASGDASPAVKRFSGC